jgi:hypothetical protein
VWLPWSPCLALCFLSDLLGQIALFDKTVQLLGELLPVLVIFVGIVGLEVDGQELQSTLFGSQIGVLRPSIAQSGKRTHHDVAQMMLQKSRTVLGSCNFLQIALLFELHGQFIWQFDHFIQSRAFLEKLLVFGRRIEEILALVGQSKEIVPLNQIFLEQLHHSIPLIFKFTLQCSNGLNGYLLWRCKRLSFYGISVRIVNKILHFFVPLKRIDLLIEQNEILVVFETDFVVLTSNFVADRTEVEVIRQVVHNAVVTQSRMSHISRRVSDEILDKNSFGLDFDFQLGSDLLEDTPLRKVTINHLHVVVFCYVVDLHVAEAAASGF